MLGIGVMGGTRIKGSMLGVTVNSGVRVSVNCPTRVGVKVKVRVGVMGVDVGASVAVFVVVGGRVEVGTGSKKNCSNVQEESRNAQMSKADIFFIGSL